MNNISSEIDVALGSEYFLMESDTVKATGPIMDGIWRYLDSWIEVNKSLQLDENHTL